GNGEDPHSARDDAATRAVGPPGVTRVGHQRGTDWMMMSTHTLDEARERAALYALGALRGDEARDFEAHLRAGCDVCAGEVQAFSTVAAELGRTASPKGPGPDVRARVLQRIGVENILASQPVFEQDGVRFVRSEQLQWSPGNVPAVEIKTLAVDAERGYVT